MVAPFHEHYPVASTCDRLSNVHGRGAIRRVVVVAIGVHGLCVSGRGTHTPMGLGHVESNPNLVARRASRRHTGGADRNPGGYLVLLEDSTEVVPNRIRAPRLRIDYD